MNARLTIAILLSAVVIAAVYGFLFHSKYRRDLDLYTVRVEQNLSALERSYKAKLDEIEGDAMFLARLPSVREYSRSRSTVHYPEIAQALEAFFHTHVDLYHHIRLVDADGMERIRFNNIDNRVVAVPANELQDKSDRYYYNRLKSLRSHQIYLSRIDLNMEQGEIKEPHIPVFRVGIPLFDRQNRFAGAVLLNVKGHRLLRDFEPSAWTTGGRLYFVNREGYFLEAPEDTLEWGFMFGRDDHTMVDVFPELWERLQHNPSITQLTEKGLFVTHAVTSDEIMSAPYGRWHTIHEGMFAGENSRPLWSLVAFVPQRELYAGAWNDLYNQLWIGVLLLLGLTVLYAFLHQARENRRRAVEELAISEERFRTLANNVPGMVFRGYQTAAGRRGFSWVSVGSRELLGVEPEELVEDWTLFRVHPEDLEGWREALAHALEHGEDWQYKGRLVRPDGEVRWWQGVAKLMVHSDRGMEFDGILFDITEEQRAEELQAKADKLEVATSMAATIAHEFNNPLAIMQGNLDLMQFRGKQVVAQEKACDTIGRQIARMRDLVDKLLEIEDIKAVDYAAGMKILSLHREEKDNPAADDSLPGGED
ncbi:PAS domain-containing protein [bacterium]|nr:PAS domain-containing protein [bacterium]